MSPNFIAPSSDPRAATWAHVRRAPLHQLLGKPIAWGDPAKPDNAAVGILDSLAATESYVDLEITVSDFARPIVGAKLTPRVQLQISIPNHTDAWIGYWAETLS